ncbi:MAG TPA: DUF4159 domain-containing protein [Opitutaceae bacterium]|nr:DUF4159 domain-containing protein [Opitutaceae bacterium]
MCRNCHSPGEAGTRRRFLSQIVAGALAAPALLRAASVRAAARRGGAARLITPNFNWNFHIRQERQFVGYLKSLPGLPPVSFEGGVRPDQLEKLCDYSILCTNYLTAVKNPDHLSNLREYALQGGVIYIDHCTGVEPDRDLFERAHLACFAALFPGSPIRRLGPRHPLFSAYYPVDLDDLSARPIYGVFDDDRMIALLSMVGLFCGWPDRPWFVPKALRMLTNIYAYGVKS